MELDARKLVTAQDFRYMVSARRTLHKWPEGGFDTPRTLEFIRNELSQEDIPFSEDYGLSSIVGYINPGKEHTIALRADLDALPITEKNDIPYKSQHEGFMHACGHDAHTAILLGTAKVLKSIESQLKCSVKLVFQACEETAIDKRSGSNLMVQDGVLDDVDMIIGLHVTNEMPVGNVRFAYGPCTASSNPITIEFFGKSAHATTPDLGADALAMAVKFINDYQYLLTRRVNPKELVASSICSLRTGTDSYNVVADYSILKMALRTYSDDVNDVIENLIRQCAENSAAEMGGTTKVQAGIVYPVLVSNKDVTDRYKKAAEEVLGADHVSVFDGMLASEDFAFYTKVKPASFMWLGSGNREKGCTAPQHSNCFMIDEDAMKIGAECYVQFVLDTMNDLC